MTTYDVLREFADSWGLAFMTGVFCVAVLFTLLHPASGEHARSAASIPFKETPTVADRDIDEISGTPTTGHSWDGIRELDTPMPRWWLWTLYATIAFAIVYMVLYPAIPLVHGATQGLLGWTSRGQLGVDVSEAVEAQAGLRAKIAAADMATIARDPELLDLAARAGRSAFLVNCVQCHGSGGAGANGYPNLVDDDWLWGGTIDEIHQTIAHGVRNADPESRQSEMPGFGRDGILEPPAIRDVSAYVLTLSGGKPGFGDATKGETVFADNCAACHGASGEGMKEMGAPALNDGIWLRSGKQEAIVAQITNPRHGVMPAWEPRLGAETVKELAAYVYALGGAKTEQAATR